MILLVLLLLVPACSASDTTWEDIKESGVLSVGLDPTYPPFEFFDGQSLYGLDVDLAQEIAGDLGLQPQFVHFGYDGLYDGLATGQVDVLISALVVLPHQLRDFAYTAGYFDAGLVLISRDTVSFSEMSELEGKILAVELGARGHLLATTWQRELVGLSVHTFDTPDEAMAAVLNADADAALVDNISGRLYLKQTPELQISINSVTEEPFAIVVREEDEVLLDELNQSLSSLRSSGRLDTIISHWLDE